jgi:predicted nucleic acid-binding protein
MLEDRAHLFTCNYVLVETYSLLQHRIGMAAVNALHNDVVPALQVVWVDESAHRRGSSALLAAGRRNLSLVDCVSFEVMRQLGLEEVFTLDPHFEEQGFNLIPAPLQCNSEA